MFLRPFQMRPMVSAVRGFSLLEVMIALLIFSLGLLGLGSLIAVSVKTNHSAYLRTQASFLAQSMADRMRANPAGVWKAAYDGDGYPKSGTPSTCASGCSYSDVVLRDQLLWSQQMTDLLPAPTASIACERNSSVSVSAVAQLNRAPYDGLCTITMEWAESRLDQQTSGGRQTFAWVFQP